MSPIARFDKYDGKSGGFRATLAVALADDLVTPANSRIKKPLGVGIDANGKVVLAASDSGIIGVICADSAKAIGDPIDVMTAGEIVDLDPAAFVVGDTYYAASATGLLTTTNTGTRVGFVVADQSTTNVASVLGRLIVRARELAVAP